MSEAMGCDGSIPANNDDTTTTTTTTTTITLLN
jgi:hypothetical protein